MTPECQSLDISINKIFKDQIRLKFEANRLFFEKIEQKNKLQTARLNIIDYIHNIWYNDSIINNKLIINGFNHAAL